MKCLKINIGLVTFGGFIGSKLVDGFEEEVAVLDRTRHFFDEDLLSFL